jgi:hypothetical protein
VRERAERILGPPEGIGSYATGEHEGEAARAAEREGWGRRMAIELSLFNNSVTTFVTHLTTYYEEEAELETYVICARVKSTNIPGGSGLNWIVGPNGHERAGGLLQEVLKAVEDSDGNGGGQA